MAYTVIHTFVDIPLVTFVDKVEGLLVDTFIYTFVAISMGTFTVANIAAIVTLWGDSSQPDPHATLWLCFVTQAERRTWTEPREWSVSATWETWSR